MQMYATIGTQLELHPKCFTCGRFGVISVDREAYTDWYPGDKLAQDAFPELSKGEREFLVTSLCPACTDELFPEEEDTYAVTSE